MGLKDINIYNKINSPRNQLQIMRLSMNKEYHSIIIEKEIDINYY